jgi:DNA polymerase-3 subunit delta
MVAVKAHQAQAFLASSDPRYGAVLFYGPDAGLVLERAQALAKAAAGRNQPAGEILRLDDADLEGDPDRLAVELRTVAMFGGRKVVRAAAGRRVTAAALRPLLEDAVLEGVLIVEAGNLKPDDSLRVLFEKSERAAAVACYGDGAQDLEALVRDVLKDAHIAITAEAREALVARLGADRALSRNEIEKLTLFAQGKPQIEVSDVEAVVGDVSELALERVYFAAASGEGTRAVAECGRAVSSGESPQAIIAATQRHFQRLHRVRVAIERGQTLDEALRQIRPPLHFKQKDAFAGQCRAWTSERLAEALRRIAVAAKAARLSSSLEEALTERLLLSLAMMARSGTRSL